MSAGAAAVLAAALWAGTTLAGPWWLALIGAGAAFAAAAPRGNVARLAVLVVALLATGAGLAGGRLALQDGAVLAALAERGANATVAATVVTEARDTRYGTWQVVRVGRLDGAGVRERAVLWLPAQSDPAPIGSRLAGRVTVQSLGHEGFDRHLRTLHAAAALRPVGRLAVVEPPGFWLGATTTVRDRTRAAAHRRLDPDRAALLAALVTGDRRDESEARREQFRASSLTHLVVVSGKHVGLMLAGVMGLALLARAGPRSRAWLALAALCWYVVLVRWQPSVLRAAVMAALVLAAGLAGRRGNLRHALAVAVLLLLLADPLLGRHLGFVLSVSATAGVLVVAPWLMDRLPGPRWLRGPAAVCLGAQLGVTPMLLQLEGGIPVAAVPANLVAVPAAALAQAIGLVAAALAQVSITAGGVVAALAGPPLGLVLAVAETFADWPRLDPRALLSPAALLIAAGLSLRRRRPAAAWAALATGVLLAVAPVLRPAPAITALTITMIDVGQGDAVLVEVPAGAGRRQARLLYDAGADGAALSYLRERRIRHLDAAVVSHPHHDHTGGLPAVLRRIRVGALLVGPDALDERAADSAHAANDIARSAGVPVVALAAGDRLALGAAELVALSPPGKGAVGPDLNEISLVLRVDHPDGRVLLTGDAEVLAQTLMLRDRAALHAEVLKVPHHGGNTNAPGFLAAPEALVALVGVGADNAYGHPHPDVLGELEAAGAAIYRTDLHGTVRVQLHDRAIVRIDVGHAAPEPLAVPAGLPSTEAGEPPRTRARRNGRPVAHCRHGPAPPVPRRRTRRAARPALRRAAARRAP